ncbi:MAG: OmpA family protein [Turneriella sp.]|nr:OmpA family protein [Turneriella sp.]
MLLLGWRCNGTYHSTTQEGGAADVLPQPDKLIGSIYFNSRSAKISRKAATELNRIALKLRTPPYHRSRVIITGYADKSEGVEEDFELANERAQNTAMALERRGIDLNRIIIDQRPASLAKVRSGQKRVDIFTERQATAEANLVFPLLVTFFILSVLAAALLIFRRKN